jgi:hypothetical protein
MAVVRRRMELLLRLQRNTANAVRNLYRFIRAHEAASVLNCYVSGGPIRRWHAGCLLLLLDGGEV